MDIIIVGGGTAGLVSALILKKRFENLKIQIVKSDRLGIIGVGEGSEGSFNSFLEFTEIDFRELIQKADATVKLGIMFEGWTKKPYFHNVSDLHIHNSKLGQYLGGYAYQIINNHNQYEEVVTKIIGEEIDAKTNQYHFNTFKLNEFLVNKCIERGIIITEDEIKKVKTNKNGISSIEGDKQKYQSKFYIDCSGFKKILLNSLKPKWVSYQNHLTLNEAIAFQTEDTEEYHTYTTAKAMKYGWMWRIPTYGRWGNGYVFNNNYTNAEKALQEAQKLFNKKITIGKNIKFEAGYIKEPWLKNCVAIGLSSSFVEPLEATSIGTAINQTFLLMHYINNYTEQSIKQYNQSNEEILENIRDFVFIHYLVKKNNSKFWKDIQNIQPPSKLKDQLDMWKYNLPIAEDMPSTNYKLFNEYNFANVLWGLDFFDKKTLAQEFYNLSPRLQKYVNAEIATYYAVLNSYPQMGHKQYLDKIRNDYR